MEYRRKIGAMAFALVGLIGLCVWGQQAVGQGRNVGKRWEYAELVVSGERSVLITEHRQAVLEPPSSRSTPQSSDSGRVVKKVNVRLMHMNKLGEKGWEVTSVSALQEGVAYLLRRQQ